MIFDALGRLLLQDGTPLLLDGCGCDALILQSAIEIDSRYMMPSYITYEMVAGQIHPLVKVRLVDDPELPGIYIGLVNDFLAQGESYIIQTVLSNYVEIPLTTIDGCSFQSMINHPKYKQMTYVPIMNLFKASALYQLYLNYFAMGGVVGAPSGFLQDSLNRAGEEQNRLKVMQDLVLETQGRIDRLQVIYTASTDDDVEKGRSERKEIRATASF